MTEERTIQEKLYYHYKDCLAEFPSDIDKAHKFCFDKRIGLGICHTAMQLFDAYI